MYPRSVLLSRGLLQSARAVPLPNSLPEIFLDYPNDFQSVIFTVTSIEDLEEHS